MPEPYGMKDELYLSALEYVKMLVLSKNVLFSTYRTFMNRLFHHLHNIKATSTFILQYNALIQTLQRSPNHE